MQVDLDRIMPNNTLNALANVLGATFTGDDATFLGVSTDTRKIKKGDVFVALKGPNFDAHDYLAQAKEKGAIAAVVQRMTSDCELTQIKVDDTLLALGEMAKAKRNSFLGKVIGLTGSNGKTTVKELVASILSQKGKVLATKGNFNNDIGLPLTLLELENDEKFAVIEMGANHLGEINYLTQITQPDVALITNAGSAHLEGFGSLDGVAKAKGEIFSGLPANGTAIINIDDNYSGLWLSLTGQYLQKTFSLTNINADVHATEITSTASGGRFILHVKREPEVVINLPLSGKHNVANALVAAAVANACGVNVNEIKAGLENIRVVQGRLTFLKADNGAAVIDDTYNANLDSTKAAINVLSEQQAEKGETYLVLGDLFESGENAVAIHQQIGVYAKQKNISEVLTIGELTRHTTASFADGARHFESKKALVDYLLPQLDEEAVVLVKGSRGMKMEQIVSQLTSKKVLEKM